MYGPALYKIYRQNNAFISGGVVLLNRPSDVHPAEPFDTGRSSTWDEVSIKCV